MFNLSHNKDVNSNFCFVQPVHKNVSTTGNPLMDNYLNAKYLSYLPSNGALSTCNLEFPTLKSCDNCVNPIFLTSSGFEKCSCGNNISKRQYKKKRSTSERSRTETLTSDRKPITVASTISRSKVYENGTTKPKILPISRSCSYGENFGAYDRNERRVSSLVDELLLKIYGGRDRKFSSGGRDTIDYSTDSSSHIVINTNASLLMKKSSFTGLSEDKCRKWKDLMCARLMHKTLPELRTLKETLDYNISHTGSQLIRQLKRRDLLSSKRDAQYDVITAILQAKSAKRSGGEGGNTTKNLLDKS